MPKAKKRLTLYIATGLVLVLIIGAVVLMNTGGTQSVAELLSLGERYLLELNYEAALVQFMRVIENDPKNPRGYHGAARAHIGLGQPEQAIDILNQGIEMTGDAELQALLDEILAAQQAELDRIAQEEAEQERMRREAEEAERERQAEEERIAQEEAEQERQRVEEEEAERERQEQEEAQREQEAAQPPPAEQEPPPAPAGPRQAQAIAWHVRGFPSGMIDLEQAARPEGFTVNSLPNEQDIGNPYDHVRFFFDSAPGTWISPTRGGVSLSGMGGPYEDVAGAHGLNRTFTHHWNGDIGFGGQNTATVVFEVNRDGTVVERYTVHFRR